MKRSSYILAVMLLLASSSAFAKGSKFGAGARIGSHVAPLAGVGLDFFYSPSQDYTLGITYATGSADFSTVAEAGVEEEDTTTIEKADVAATLALLEARYFFLWGMNVSGGIGMRTVDMELEVAESLTDSSIATEIKTQSTVFNIGIGVMGRWDSIYVSFDLLAVTSAMSGKAQVTTTSTGAATESTDLTDLNDDLIELGEALGESGSLQLANIGLGIMF